MPDRFFFPLAFIAAVLLIALASVYPQGVGARSPKPFGHAVIKQAPVKAGKAPAGEKDSMRGPF